ncbi:MULTISPECIES: lytic transglycosylase domain-containing protein [Ralstonia]|uniref:Transglycosylase SLT domain-containing protein n=2 Tax=Ralstonia TaxID=48736 RepID=A0AAD2EPL1_9RALS|nr:hypothetical protein LMG18091_01661 [Ralstonia wenshanensis]
MPHRPVPWLRASVAPPPTLRDRPYAETHITPGSSNVCNSATRLRSGARVHFGMRTRNAWVRSLLALLAWLPTHALADCIDDAAAYHGVNAQVLRAIGYQESHLNPQAHNRNRNGSEDLGMFQINTIHLPELSRYGIGRQALYDPCVSAYVAAWHLARKVQLHGNSWHAIGAYHSESAGENGIYARAVEGILNRRLAGRTPIAAVHAPAPEPAGQALRDTAQPMRQITLRHTPSRAPDNQPPPDDHWLDAMLANLNQSASLRERFSR